MSVGLAMFDVCFWAYIVFYLWVVFFGGAARLEGTWLGAWELPAMSTRQLIKVYSSVTLFLMLGLYIAEL
mgnify:CR=1 FL=1